MIRPRKRHYAYLPVLAGILTILLLVACHWYRHTSAIVLPPLTEQLGRLALKQGDQSEAAGDYNAAARHYQRALIGILYGEKDRRHGEKSLGIVRWKLGQYDEAITHLQRARERSSQDLDLYGPLVDSLLETNRLDNAAALIQSWRNDVANDPARIADTHRASGILAWRRHDLDAAQAHFETAIELVKGHESLVDLAKLLDEQGRKREAESRLTTWLSSAPPGDVAVAAWATLTAWAG